MPPEERLRQVLVVQGHRVCDHLRRQSEQIDLMRSQSEQTASQQSRDKATIKRLRGELSAAQNKARNLERAALHGQYRGPGAQVSPAAAPPQAANKRVKLEDGASAPGSGKWF